MHKVCLETHNDLIKMLFYSIRIIEVNLHDQLNYNFDYSFATVLTNKFVINNFVFEVYVYIYIYIYIYMGKATHTHTHRDTI